MPTRVEHIGVKANIELFELDDGTCLAQDFLNDLSPKERQKVDNLFEMMGINGEIRNDTKFKKLEGSDGIFEFKSFQVRLLCFYGKGSPKKLIIALGVRKKKDKHDKGDISRAEQIRKMYLGE